MNWAWKIALEPLFLLIIMGISSFISFKLYRSATTSDHVTAVLSTQIRTTVLSEIENTARFFVPLNSSASSLAAIISSSLNGTELLSFNLIQEKVAPSLFLALSTIPCVSHASYVGMDGLMFVYTYTNTLDGKTFVVFSNSSSSLSSSCYIQSVIRHTGKLSEKAVMCDMGLINSTLEETMRRRDGSAWLGSDWGRERGLVFLYNAAVGGRGVITIGYPAKLVADHFSRLEFYNGNFHLATSDGRVLVQSKLKGARIDVRNGTVLVDNTVVHSCKSDGVTHFDIKIREKKHTFYCSNLEIGGIESVYVLAFPTSAHKSRIFTVGLLVLMLAIIVISLGALIIMVLRSAQGEMHLRAALIKQMEASHQAERKRMNRSFAFASASHDIRASLAAITGFIDLCASDPYTDLSANLDQMRRCATDLLGILNSVLDASKIEAGKMELEEEEFDVAQLLEDVVEMFYPLGMAKGVDVVLDLTDCSILKFSLVRGDRGKLKQILCNLLSNATKFTSQGHISVRAKVRKASPQDQTDVSNSKSLCVSKCMPGMQNGSSTSLKVEENPNCMDYIFEIDDTGEGIPKERREWVFENFVQVRETALGEGTGLGLGIVQCLVRLMGGEIEIVDKDQGERGSCFRFSVVLTACHPPTGDLQGRCVSNNGYRTCIHRCFWMKVESLPPRSNASHVILFLAGEERRRVTKKLMRKLGLRVSTVKRSEDLVHFLERIEQQIHLSSANSSNNSTETSSTLLLIVIDANAGPTSELCSLLAELREGDHSYQFKTIWLDNPISRKGTKSIPPCDHIVSRPLHGSQLYRALGLLPEFGEDDAAGLLHTNSTTTEEITEVKDGDDGSDKPLTGKNVLVVEDDRTLCKLSTTILRKLGATLHVCENGKEAFDVVCKSLTNKGPGCLTFDYIFMDCKMPFLDGFDATRLIRQVEEDYGVHTPIVALTAYSSSEEIQRSVEAGMDFHLVKPLRIQDVLQLLQLLNP